MKKIIRCLFLDFLLKGLIVGFVVNVLTFRYADEVNAAIMWTDIKFLKDFYNIPEQVTCSYFLENNPNDGERFKYRVEMYFKYEKRRQFDQLLAIRNNSDFFIFSDSIFTERLRSNEIYYSKESDKYAVGFKVQYGDLLKFKDAKVNFIIESETQILKEVDKCDQFILQEY